MSHAQIQSILENAATGSLGSLTKDLSPFVSLVTVAAAGPRLVAMLLSDLAVHTQNLLRNPSASLLLVPDDGESDDPLQSARVTLTGAVTRLTRQEDGDVREAFLAKHPSAAMYADFGDFAFHVLHVDQAHLVAGFGKIVTVSGDDLV